MNDNGDGRIQRLEGLAQVWGDLYCYHPALSVPDEQWEQRLVEAIPAVEAAKTPEAYASALNEGLLRHLDDSWTHAVADTSAPARPARESSGKPHARFLPSGIGYLDARAVSARARSGSLTSLSDALATLAQAPGVILDLRWPARPEDNPWREEMWPGAFGLFLDTPLAAPGRQERVHAGWTEEDGSVYDQRWEVQPTPTLRPLRSPGTYTLMQYQDVRLPDLSHYTGALAVLVNDTSLGMLDAALTALQLADRAFVVHESGDELYRAGRPLRLWGDVEVWMRLYRLVAPAGWVEVSPNARVPAGHSLRRVIAVAEKLLQTSRPKAPPCRPIQIPARISPPRSEPNAEPLSRESRLLGLIKIWRVLNDFFPHLEFADLDWPRLPRGWVPRVEAATDTVEYYTVLMELGARLNDSHVHVNHPAQRAILEKLFGTHVPPIRLQPVGGQAVITRLYDGAEDAGLRVGMIVTHIDGRPVAEIAAERGRNFSASTPQARDVLTYPFTRWGTENSPVELTVEDEDGSRTIVTRRTVFAFAPMPPLPIAKPVRRVKEFGYVDLGAVERQEVETAFRRLRNTPGLILDMRGYPKSVPQFTVISRLIDRPCPSVRFNIPLRSGSRRLEWAAGPSRVGWETWDSGNYVVYPDPDLHYAGPVVVLIDVRAVSSAEDFCIYLRNAGRATFVGSPTTGTDGNVTWLRLPGGGTFGFTGMRITYADGSRFQNIGILPDVYAEPTPAGIRAGRDEVLEAGVATLRRLIEAAGAAGA
ncbi:MAG: hypothetical protein HYX51_05650 [Chloroflexi bacterium]|nr:hypothetical protein [Chloroflexota bacterium]